MFFHKKELIRAVRVTNPDPRWAQIIAEQYAGADSEATALNTYLTQRYNASDPTIRDLLTDIGTEELSHWEMVGELIHQHGGVVKHKDASGAPWTSHYAAVTGDIVTDLYSDIAGELRARDLYLKLINMVEDPGSRDALLFLGQREEAHAASFARALEHIKGSIELPRAWFQHPNMKSTGQLYYCLRLTRVDFSPPAPAAGEPEERAVHIGQHPGHRPGPELWPPSSSPPLESPQAPA